MLYYNSIGVFVVFFIDYENEFCFIFIMNVDEINRIYYFCRYYRYMFGYIGDEGYMVLDFVIENELLLNNYYILDYYVDGFIIDYFRYVIGYFRIFGLFFDGYFIYGFFGYDDFGNVIRMIFLYWFKVGDEVDGVRLIIIIIGIVNYIVIIVNNEFLIDGSVLVFLNLDCGKIYIFNFDDFFNLNLLFFLFIIEDGWYLMG